jgi:hypothetical protein
VELPKTRLFIGEFNAPNIPIESIHDAESISECAFLLFPFPFVPCISASYIGRMILEAETAKRFVSHLFPRSKSPRWPRSPPEGTAGVQGQFGACYLSFGALSRRPRGKICTVVVNQRGIFDPVDHHNNRNDDQDEPENSDLPEKSEREKEINHRPADQIDAKKKDTKAEKEKAVEDS